MMSRRDSLSRGVATVVVVSAVIGVWTAQPAAAMSIDAYGKAKSYPLSRASMSTIDPLKYYARSCASYTAYKVLHVSDVKVYHAGNAVQWKKWAIDHGYKVNKTPAVGAIAWYGSSYGRGYGHVAWVQTRNAAGTKVHLREYGWPTRGKFGERDVNKSQRSWPQYFLHVEQKPSK